MTPLAPTADDLWQTSLFLPAPAAVAPGEISPRLAYQLLLHGRAVLVDPRDPATRQREGDIDPAVLPRRPAAGGATLVATAPAPGARALAGGLAAWAAAGLPVVPADAPLHLAA